MIKLNSINKTEAIRYMGYGNSTPDDNMLALIDKCELKLLQNIDAKYLYSDHNIYFDDGYIGVENTLLRLASEDIKNHLSSCQKVVLMCATLSIGVDNLLRKLQITDLTQALITDCLASAAIEQVCNEVDNIIASNFNDYYATWRFSPGYGDLSIDIQSDFLNVLNSQKRIGLTVTPDNILAPTKSVTAIIGLSKTPLNIKKRGCASCNMAKSCQYRKRGERCEF